MAGDELNDFLYTAMPFARLIGAEAVEASKDEVVLRLDWTEERTTTGGVLHGGALMALADCAGAWCAYLNLAEGTTTTTVESKTNFFRGVREGHATASSRPLHVGRSFIVVETEVRDAAGTLTGKTTQTQAVLSRSR